MEKLKVARVNLHQAQNFFIGLSVMTFIDKDRHGAEMTLQHGASFVECTISGKDQEGKPKTVYAAIPLTNCQMIFLESLEAVPELPVPAKIASKKAVA